MKNSKKTRTFTTADGCTVLDLWKNSMLSISAAEVLFKNPMHIFAGGYLAHNAIELMLKAWLLAKDGKFQGIHKLGDLYTQLENQHGAQPLPKRIENILTKVENFGQLRYPNTNNPIEIGTDDWDDIEQLHKFIRDASRADCNHFWGWDGENSIVQFANLIKQFGASSPAPKSTQLIYY